MVLRFSRGAEGVADEQSEDKGVAGAKNALTEAAVAAMSGLLYGDCFRGPGLVTVTAGGGAVKVASFGGGGASFSLTSEMSNVAFSRDMVPAVLSTSSVPFSAAEPALVHSALEHLQ